MLASHWTLRLGQLAEDTAGLVDELLQMDQIPARGCSLPG